MTHVYALVERMQVYYVGYTARLERRRKVHSRIHPDWRMLVLGAYPSPEIGLDNEKRWIKKLFELGHPLTNVSSGGQSGPIGEVSEMTRARISAAMKGKRPTPETLAKMSAAKKGKRHTPEARSRMSAAQMGRNISPEHRAKISATMKSKAYKGEGNPASKLTSDQVEEIRSLRGTISSVELSRRFGVSKTTISYIQNGKTWA